MTEVLLNVYDIKSADSQATSSTISVINNVTHFVGLGGVFHGAIEIMGEEWSFGYCLHGTGVYSCPPKRNPFYDHRDTVLLGVTYKSQEEVKRILQRLKVEWPGRSYNLLNRNCCNFCDDFCQQLGVGTCPAWLNRFASGAEATINFADKVAVSLSSWGNQIQETGQQSASWFRSSIRNWRQNVLSDGDRGSGTAQRGVGGLRMERSPRNQS